MQITIYYYFSEKSRISTIHQEIIIKEFQSHFVEYTFNRGSPDGFAEDPLHCRDHAFDVLIRSAGYVFPHSVYPVSKNSRAQSATGDNLRRNHFSYQEGIKNNDRFYSLTEGNRVKITSSSLWEFIRLNFTSWPTRKTLHRDPF